MISHDAHSINTGHLLNVLLRPLLESGIGRGAHIIARNGIVIWLIAIWKEKPTLIIIRTVK